MGKILGDISCKRVPITPVMRKLIEREITRWAKGEAPGPFVRGISYHVILEREGDALETRCRVFIHSRRFTWEGSEFGPDALSALRVALSNLRRQGRPVGMLPGLVPAMAMG